VTALVRPAGGGDGPGAPVPQTVHVAGIPMSARMLAVDRPRGVIVALHGGGVTSAYYDSRQLPGASLLRAGAALGYTVIALDRPGYGPAAASGAGARFADAIASPAVRVDLAYGAIDALLAGHSRGAGVFMMAHSAGCMLAVRLAADPRGAGLLGLEIAGIGLEPHPDAEFMGPVTGQTAMLRRPGRAELRDALWNPARLYPPGAADAVSYAAVPDYESADTLAWIGALPGLAAQVRIPVHYTLGDHERVWSRGPQALAQVGALFTASPRVVTAEQADAAHNLSLGWSARSYHLKVLSFAEECIVMREHSAD
jgi:pimeloyl-ACP methyl ester carboxylesterase